ncbi:MAG: CAP domain-containing protein [Clostridiales bacterium]|nr:CAP domain-containing protein [Clostridiales bacterium]
MKRTGLKRTFALVVASTVIFASCSMDGSEFKDSTSVLLKGKDAERVVKTLEYVRETEPALPEKTEIQEETAPAAPETETTVQTVQEQGNREVLFGDLDLTMYAVADGSIRTDSDVDADVIGNLEPEQEVHVTGISERGMWYRIEIDGETFYVLCSDLMEELPEAVMEDEEEETAETTAAPVAAETETTVTTVTAVVETEPAPEPEPEPEPERSINYPPEGTLEYDLFILVNEAREDAGLEPYSWSGTLADAADIRAEEIVEEFSHTRPNGEDCFSLSGVWAENIAAGQSSAQEVFNCWMDSDGHRANILDPDYETCGFSMHYEEDSEYGYYWAQEFGY